MAAPRKPVRWFEHITRPPFTEEGQLKGGTLIRLLQEGELLSPPKAKPMPSIGPRCGELRFRDGDHNWRIIYRVDDDAILIVHLFPKQTQKTPQRVIKLCKKRLADYDVAKAAALKEIVERAFEAGRQNGKTPEEGRS
jgi:phage-related protein